MYHERIRANYKNECVVLWQCELCFGRVSCVTGGEVMLFNYMKMLHHRRPFGRQKRSRQEQRDVWRLNVTKIRRVFRILL